MKEFEVPEPMKSSFSRSFSVFAAILLVALTILGSSFQILVKNYLTDTTYATLEQDGQIISNLAEIGRAHV